MRKNFLLPLITLIILLSLSCRTLENAFETPSITPFAPAAGSTAVQIIVDTPTPLPQPATDTPEPSPQAEKEPTSQPPRPQLHLDTIRALDQLDAYPCPDSDFTCVRIEVPLDHFDSANTQTIQVVFGVLPASGERKGMFVIATGGPGSSGLVSADDYVSWYDPSIPEHFDIVFFDQRGIGQSGEFQCPAAVATYYRLDAETETGAQEESFASASSAFVDSCLAEAAIWKEASQSGVPAIEMVPYLGTDQAIEDLEAFRQALLQAGGLAANAEKFWLYGESYGTQYAQTYAMAHPENLAGLILDGTVDLSLSGTEFLQEQAQAMDDVLVMTLQACNEDPACLSDFLGVETMAGTSRSDSDNQRGKETDTTPVGGDAVAVYDALAARLAAGPASFDFPLPSGGKERRTFTDSDLESAVISYLYSEADRMILQRALAAAANDNFIPLARVLYDSLGLDPETLDPIPDPTFSDALYYAVQCSDYEYTHGEGSPAGQAEEYLRQGDQAEEELPRFDSIFYGDLPCIFWPNDASSPYQDRRESLNATGIPTLVLAATADPATPFNNGMRVFLHLDDGYLIKTEGGPHVTFGWGNSCPDNLVTDFLVNDQLPRTRQTTCSGVVTEEYVPLAPQHASAFADPLEAMWAVDTEIYYLPEYYYWDVETPTAVGCTYGGALEFEPSDEGERFRFTGCAFSEGFVMTGEGTYDYDREELTFDVAVTGIARGNLHYVYKSDGSIRVTGEYDGEHVNLSN